MDADEMFQKAALEEYKSLRDEILRNDTQVHAVLGFTVAGLGALMASTFQSKNPWPEVFALLVLILANSLVTRLRLNTFRIAEYIRICLEPAVPGLGWEERLCKFRRGKKSKLIMAPAQMPVQAMECILFAIIGAMVSFSGYMVQLSQLGVHITTHDESGIQKVGEIVSLSLAFLMQTLLLGVYFWIAWVNYRAVKQVRALDSELSRYWKELVDQEGRKAATPGPSTI